MRRTIAIGVMALMLTTGFILALPVGKVAALAAPAWTYYPSANNGFYHWYIPHHGLTPSPEIEVFNDLSSIGPNVNYASNFMVQTNDFNNPYYVGAGYYHNATKWLSNATIWAVDIIIIFDPRYTDTSPTLQLMFSSNNKASWNASSVYAPVSLISSGGVFLWNITTQVPSNASALLNLLYSTNFWVECDMSLIANEYAPVDYLGFRVEWTQWTSWNYTPPPIPPSDIGAGLSAIQTGVGFGGLIGVILTPPIGIWIMKNSDDKGKTFLGMMCFGAACAGLFMFGIG